MLKTAVPKLIAALLGSAGLCLPGIAMAQAQSAVRQGFDLQVPISPAPVPLGEDSHLCYELHLTNFAGEPLQLMRVEALDAATGTVLGDFQGAELGGRIGGGEADGRDVVAPGMRAVVYLGLSIKGVSTPHALIHRIAFRPLAADREAFVTVEGGAVDIDQRPLPVLGPPLRGGPWVAVYDPAMERGHRRVFYAVDGRARIPGRFAIDWMRPPNDPRQGATPLDDGAGADVLAVADAVVAATRDGVAEPSSSMDISAVTIADAAGNYIALDLGAGRYAVYEHLQPGLLVKPGDRVRQGQVIAALGATGQASQPHLHFHVSDSALPLPAEGQPYRLSGLTVLGAYPSIDAFFRGEAWNAPVTASETAPSFPTPNLVVRFPEGCDHC